MAQKNEQHRSGSDETTQQTIVPADRPTAVAAPTAPFDAEILTGQLAPSSIEMYKRDFATYLAFAGSFASAVEATTLARWRTHLAQETDHGQGREHPNVAWEPGRPDEARGEKRQQQHAVTDPTVEAEQGRVKVQALTCQDRLREDADRDEPRGDGQST